MTERYTVFDVETPNRLNDRMSALGITVVENGEITAERAWLINPEQWFDGFNMALTGITPEAVRGKPTFGELWPALEPYFSGGVLVAHNAPFDMCVLAKCLRAYGIDWRGEAPYACTCRIGRRALPYLPNHKLNTMCAALGIALDHHNAMSDAHAAAELLRYYISMGEDVSAYVKSYRFY